MEQKIAVVTGGNRGLGLETCRELAKMGHHVILTSRALEKAERAVLDCQKEDLSLEPEELDVASDQSVNAFFERLQKNHGRLDILVNNAGAIFENQEGQDSSILAIPPSILARAFDNNTLGAYRTLQHALPMMNDAGFGRVVNVSSGMGALNDMGSGYPAYRLSKAALNALTILFSLEASAGVKINAVCPGWVRTEMGGANATRDLQEGVAGIVWAANLPQDGPSGGFFRDGKRIDW